MRKPNCIIVHGGDADDCKGYNKHWMPWTKKQLEKRGIKTETPLMPLHESATYLDWKKIFDKLKVDKNTILIGHSRGCAFLVRWLGDKKINVKKLILVAPWKIANKEYKKTFYDYDIDKGIKNFAKEIVFFTSNTEDVDGKKSLKTFHKALGGRIINLKNHGHYDLEAMGTEEFPELLKIVLE
jgi:predicted alpha/beta hydrolase family esterase